MTEFVVMRAFDVDEARDCESIEALQKINEAARYLADFVDDLDRAVKILERCNSIIRELYINSLVSFITYTYSKLILSCIIAGGLHLDILQTYLLFHVI